MKFALLIAFIFQLASPHSHAEEPAKQLSLGDLGFSKDVLEPNKKDATLLNVRASKLKTHQILGIATWALMGATMLSGPDEGKTSKAHKILGLATAGTYFSTAYFSLSAPDPLMDEGKGRNVKLHKTLGTLTFGVFTLAAATRVFDF